mmetsp:Transcript_133834/g.373148  ORF Transcript_133834/g.373148 Transcript_133834/m.373148 type:complete len:269 (-) Transcript_133834:374-1180(-)
MAAPRHLLLPPRPGQALHAGRTGEAVLPLHGPRPLVPGDAPGPPDPLHDDEVAPGRLQRPVGHPDDGRREVPLEGAVGPGIGRRPHEVSALHDRELQGHHSRWFRQEEDVHLLEPRVRRAHVPEHRAHLEGDHVQRCPCVLRVPGRQQRRAVRLLRHPGRTILPHVLRGAVGQPEQHVLPDPLRHRSGSLLQADARGGPQARPGEPPAPGQARPAAREVLPAPARRTGQDVGLGHQLRDLPYRSRRGDPREDPQVRLLRRARHCEGAA